MQNPKEMVKPKINTLFFDAAGTLISLAEPVGVTYAAAAKRHGLDATPEAFETAFRSAWKALPPRPATDSPRPEDDREWWRQLVLSCLNQVCPNRNGFPFERWFEELYEHFAGKSAWRVYPDVLPALEILRPHYIMCVVSNFDRRLLRILEEWDLLAYFKHITLSSEAGADKPDPRIFQFALKKAGAQPQETLHIGDDSVHDLQGATGAGLSAFYLNRPETTLEQLISHLSEARGGGSGGYSLPECDGH